MKWLLFCATLAVIAVQMASGGTATHLKHMNKEQRKRAEILARPSQFRLQRYREREIMTKDDGRYIEKFFVLRGILNPSAMPVNQTHTIICWRTNMLRGSHLRYGWLDMDRLVEGVAGNNASEVIRDTHDFPFIPYFPGLGVPRQNEARILVLNNGRISFTFAGNVKYRHVTQHVSFASLDKEELNFERDTYWMKYAGDQKNWAPFEHNGQMLFVQQFQPMHVVAIDETSAISANIVSMKTISRALHKDILPWNTDLFGSTIRGGTQAILLPDNSSYLALFHTCVINPPDKVILTYFMGAVVFNASWPFNLISMSEVPIYKSELYRGNWSRGGLDYVLFPTSMFLAEHARYVWVSAGHQDRDGVIMKLHLKGLLATLKPVQSPSPARFTRTSEDGHGSGSVRNSTSYSVPLYESFLYY
jgi:predicted GH43/DUF377 family glycosyl hydrolase